MLISVCTVLAEGEDSLEALLTSVAAQQATLELEVVVVDRGSRALPGVLADWLPRLPRLAVVRCQGLDELAAWRR
ncbi:MAG: glycosyltransferase, partial [Armatimonadetes bacterium]|nr:glycosyltransferase [Armatimonadota bacterium]